ACSRPYLAPSCPTDAKMLASMVSYAVERGDMRSNLQSCARDAAAPSSTADEGPAWHSGEVRVEVERVVISAIYDQQLVIFREVDGERWLPFVLGIFEATAVDRTLKKIPCPRPLTHDAWLATIAALGAKLQAACIHDLDKESFRWTYFAQLRLDRGGE